MPAAPCFRSLALVAALSLSGVTAMAADTPSEPSVSDRLASARRSIEAKDWRGAQRELTAALRDGDVSIESLIQQGRSQSGGEVMVAMVTHEGPERCVAKALALLEGSDSLTGEPLVLPILPL